MRVSAKLFNVLFLCTDNSARSIMAEGLLQKLGAGRFRAYSAGSRPAETVDPLALERLRREKIELENARCKSWDEFVPEGAPELDFVITLCNNIIGETFPVWPGKPVMLHWGVFDPAVVDGDPRLKAFALAFTLLERRIALFASLNRLTLERMALDSQTQNIGDIEGV
jgi:arsenate reductase